MKISLSYLIGYIIGVVLVCASIYGMYWLVKNGSYYWWYEDMVKDTIRELVRPEALQKQ